MPQNELFTFFSTQFGPIGGVGFVAVSIFWVAWKYGQTRKDSLEAHTDKALTSLLDRLEKDVVAKAAQIEKAETSCRECEARKINTEQELVQQRAINQMQAAQILQLRRELDERQKQNLPNDF